MSETRNLVLLKIQTYTCCVGRARKIQLYKFSVGPGRQYGEHGMTSNYFLHSLLSVILTWQSLLSISNSLNTPTCVKRLLIRENNLF